MGMMFRGNRERSKLKEKIRKEAEKERIKKEKSLADRKKKEAEKTRLNNLRIKAQELEIDFKQKATAEDLEKMIQSKLEELEEEGSQDQGDQKQDQDPRVSGSQEEGSPQEEEKKLSLFEKIKNKIAPKKSLSKMNKEELMKIAQELGVGSTITEETTNSEIIELINVRKDSQENINE